MEGEGGARLTLVILRHYADDLQCIVSPQFVMRSMLNRPSHVSMVIAGGELAFASLSM